MSKQPNKGGRPCFAPTDKQRGQVEAMTAYGATEEDIAMVVGISRPTLRKHFRKELDVGAVKATAAPVRSLTNEAYLAEEVALVHKSPGIEQF